MLALDMPQTDCIIILPRKWFMIYVAAKQCARAEYLGEKYMEIKSCVSNLVAFLIQNEKGWSCGDLYSSLCYKSTVCFQHLISIGQLIYWGCFILSHCLQRRSEVKGECRGEGMQESSNHWSSMRYHTRDLFSSLSLWFTAHYVCGSLQVCSLQVNC